VEVVEVGGVDRALLRRIFEARLEWARRGEGEVPWLEDEDLDALIGRFGDDVRGMEGWLYERVQRMEEVGRIEVVGAAP
jgi:hypothetical protein